MHDEYHGVGGEYIVDKDGKRQPAKPEEKPVEQEKPAGKAKPEKG